MRKRKPTRTPSGCPAALRERSQLRRISQPAASERTTALGKAGRHARHAKRRIGEDDEEHAVPDHEGRHCQASAEPCKRERNPGDAGDAGQGVDDRLDGDARGGAEADEEAETGCR